MGCVLLTVFYFSEEPNFNIYIIIIIRNDLHNISPTKFKKLVLNKHMLIFCTM